MTYHLDPQNPTLDEKADANATASKAIKDNDIKYKFSGAFGGGFRGGLVVDEGKETGDAAPFGKKEIRFEALYEDSQGYGVIEKDKLKERGRLGPGDYHNNPIYEKKSYNILFI